MVSLLAHLLDWTSACVFCLFLQGTLSSTSYFSSIVPPLVLDVTSGSTAVQPEAVTESVGALLFSSLSLIIFSFYLSLILSHRDWNRARFEN